MMACEAPTLEDEGHSAIVIDRDTREVWSITGKQIAVAVPCREAFAALGSGWEWAMAAMALGKTAREAVEFAMKYDVFTGGSVESIVIVPA